MSHPDADLAFFARRADQERRAAAASVEPHVAQLHATLADLYSVKMRALSTAPKT